MKKQDKPEKDDVSGWIKEIKQGIREHEKNGLITKKQADNLLRRWDGI